MNTASKILSEPAQRLVDSLERLIELGVIDIPMLPEIANKALVLAQSPDTDAEEMAKLIQSDQSLAGHIMRIANSVAYTPLANLVSLQQAIARLGMDIISEITLAVSIGTKLFNTPGYEEHIAQLWRHALATGLWAKEISRHNRSNVEVAFLAGLLHSIGRPAVLQVILDLARQKNAELSDDDVMDLADLYADKVTESVVKTWKMPTLVIESVTYYQEYNNAPTAVKQAAEVNAGQQYAINMLTPEALDKEILLASPVLATLNLYQDEAEKLLEKTEAVKGRLEGLSS